MAQGRRSVGPCSVADCGLSARTKGMCPKHYEAERRILSARPCSVDGCDAKTGNGAIGMCSMHYGRQLRNGTPEESGLTRRPAGSAGTTRCVALGCEDRENEKWMPHCARHGSRAARHDGDPRGSGGVVHDVAKRIFDLLPDAGPPCRVSPESLMGRYGTYGSHRAIWWWETGQELATEEQLDHMCRNRPCVEPRHLQVVTQGENLRRSAAANSYIRDVGSDPGPRFWLVFFRDHWPS